MPALRIGIVGSRFAAHLHLLAYRRVYGVDVRLAGVTSPSAERREAFARESGATAYPSLGAMLPHVDAVDVEKIGTKEGWSHPAPDEEWQQGFYGEIQDLVECCVTGRRPQSGALVAHDTVATLYAGYVSAERKGQEVPVPLAPMNELE